MSATDVLRAHDDIFVGGSFIPSASTERIPVVNPATEQVIATVPAGGVADVDAAVDAAHAAFPSWSATSVETRISLLRALQDALQSNSGTIADTIVGELGMPIDATSDVQVNDPALMLGGYADALPALPLEERRNRALVLREPVGVVAVITPWNYPLYQIVAKVGAALAAGCTVVIKPSELAPLNAYELARAVNHAGLPPGVLNIVMGRGTPVGEALVSHPLVRMVSFTGSTLSGRRIATLAAAAPKPVTLELGGKSATIVLDDADLDSVIPRAVADCFRNAGQTCSARTRLLVPSRYVERVALLARSAAERVRLGAPTSPGTHLGPLISAEQREKVRAFIRTGLDEGARLLTGGPEQPARQPRGYYVRPTVFDRVTSDMTIAQEEIFGPVLVIIAYEDDDDAIRIANDTRYGLSGAVWSAKQERAIAVARRIDSGEVYVNGGRFNIAAPFGGTKESGYGRELGPLGILEFTQSKAILT
ncbi:aldehyde dehydrogenase family protein [Actinomadura sp. B10D3]|uniref:aldehyde dehydrogenase family protein n=1 Tax=Actinomadura sp. B10D3 TaxID=3153557 RepID=UPI00325C48B2